MFAQQEAQMDLSEAATNDAGERAKQTGLNPEQIGDIRNSSGARRQYDESAFEDKADNYGLHISENEITPVSILNEDGTVTNVIPS